jgi:hypothetical protein
VLLQQRHVPVVRFPGDVKDISEQRHPADSGVESDVRDHSSEDRPGRSQPGGLKDEISGERRAHYIAEAWNQADQSIETKAIVRPGNDKGAVEQATQCSQVLDLSGLMSTDDRWLGARCRVLAHP